MQAIYHGLKPFWEITERLQSYATSGSHGVVWEVLPGLEMLLSHVETKRDELTLQQQVPQPQRRRRTNAPPRPTDEQSLSPSPLLVCYQNTWEVLNKYNNLTDNNHEIYALATLLNPCLKKQYFIASWTNTAADQIQPMLAKNKGIWESIYGQNVPTPVSEIARSSLSVYMANMSASIASYIKMTTSRSISTPCLLLPWPSSVSV